MYFSTFLYIYAIFTCIATLFCICFRYINFFLKLKIEASGWPKWVKTQEDKDLFIQQCLDREGIILDPARIEEESGDEGHRQALSQLILGEVRPEEQHGEG